MIYQELSSEAFVSLGGGYSSYHRKLLAQGLGTKPYAEGFALDLSDFATGNRWNANRTDAFDEPEIKRLLDIVMASKRFAPMSLKPFPG